MTLDEALDALNGAPGTVTVDQADGHTDVDVTDVDRLGVRVREVRVHRNAPCDLVKEAHALPKRLRGMPEAVTPIEVDATLGGARLRSRPRGDDRDIYEVDVEPHQTHIRRTHINDQGERVPRDFTLTREQLGRLIDQAATPNEAD